MGAAIGRKDVFIMVIVDGVHVHPATIEWMMRAHPRDRMIFVSDCAPSAGMKDGQESAFGPIRVRQVNSEARVVQPNGQAGAIGGSGLLLPKSVQEFKRASAYARSLPTAQWRACSLGNAAKWLRRP